MISAVQQFQLATADVLARRVSEAAVAAAAFTSATTGFVAAVCTKGWTVTRNVKPAYAHMGHDAGMYIPTPRPRGPM